ncbi:MAG: hypothetical protein A2293_10970 [Elusimicrobia bacterium RIFOXYB2_FULL_49_7]|nr:MAG: hypothetical protein A2293_10970 [Elusimicrobia bacterium RIFOXYB2_FULL_49_7]
MGIGDFDVILISIAVLLILISFIINILAATRISRLSENVLRLETDVDERLNSNKKGESSSHGRDSKTHYMDSAIFPSAEVQDHGHSKKIRYRPPTADNSVITGTGAEEKTKTPIQTETITQDSGNEDILIVKNKKDSGEQVVITAADIASVKAPAPPAPEDKKSTSHHALGDDEKALLKNYLGDFSPLLSSNQPLSGTALKDIYENDEGEAESEIMEVVEAAPDTEKQKPDAGNHSKERSDD